MTELKPCPFCGGEAVLDKYPVRGYEPEVSFEVRCSICGQKRVGGYFDTVYMSEELAKRKAIEAWNNRPSRWHTGTPTEEGWYLCSTKASDSSVHHYDGNKWDFCPLDFVLAWQKIEPYKEKTGMTELKPCPFCGGEASIKDMGNYWLISRTYRSSCVCRVSMESDNFYDSDSRKTTKDNLIENWNRRVPEAVEKEDAENSFYS